MFNSDTPIITESEDLLDRKTFAKQLAGSILSYDQSNSFNIALYGEWGSGKTSVINMVEESLLNLTLEQEDKPIIIRFNPWLFSDQTQLTIQFFKQLSSAFIKSSRIKTIGQAMDALGAAFEFTSVIPTIGAASGTISKLIQGVGKKLADQTSSPDIQKIKDDIVKKLKKEKVKTIIIIDDVDRLSNQEIRSVFQLIKSIADFPNTVYLLAFDYDIVTGALGEVQNTDGSKYLEKIIQVPFHLPKLNQNQLMGLFFSKLDNILVDISEDEFDNNRWSMIFHSGIKPFFNTIRDVIRFINTFSLKYSFLKDEVDVIDLIGITVIQVFESNLFTLISLNKDTFCGSFSSYYSSSDKEIKVFKELYESITDKLSENSKEPILEMLSLIFPKVNTSMKNGWSQYTYNGYASIRSGNIYNKDFFDRYFSLSLDESISLKQAHFIIFTAPKEKVIKLLLDLDEKKQINLFFSYLDSVMVNAKKTDKDSERITILLKEILENWQYFHDADAEQFFSYPWNWRLVNVANNLLWTFTNESDRFARIFSIFNNDNIILSIKIQILLNFEYEHNRYCDNEKDKTPEEYTLTLEHIIELENICFKRICSLIQSNYLINQDGFSWIKWFIEKSENIDLKNDFANYMKNIVETDESLAKLISSMVGHGKGAGNFVFEIWKIDLKYMGQYFEIDKAISRMRKFIKSEEFSSLNLNNKENIIAFLAFYEVKDDAYRKDVTRPLIKEFATKNGVQLAE